MKKAKMEPKPSSLSQNRWRLSHQALCLWSRTHGFGSLTQIKRGVLRLLLVGASLWALLPVSTRKVPDRRLNETQVAQRSFGHPIIGNVHGQGGWAFQQPSPMQDVLTHGRRGGLDDF